MSSRPSLKYNSINQFSDIFEVEPPKIFVKEKIGGIPIVELIEKIVSDEIEKRLKIIEETQAILKIYLIMGFDKHSPDGALEYIQKLYKTREKEVGRDANNAKPCLSRRSSAKL